VKEKKRTGTKEKKREQNDIVESRTTQRQGCELNQHFHRHLPHHLHREAGNKRRKEGTTEKNEKRTEGVEIKRREQKEFMFVIVKREKVKGKKNREGGKEKRRKQEEARKKRPKPVWPLFCFARISNHWPCAEAAMPSHSPVSAPGSAEQKRG